METLWLYCKSSVSILSSLVNLEFSEGVGMSSNNVVRASFFWWL